MPEISPSKYMVRAGWRDVPHLTERDKAELLASTPPYLREARSEGTPSLGAGAIYPVPLADIQVDPFQIPDHWPRGYALDVGWKRTAALFGALDRGTDTVFLYSEHYRGYSEPSVHATAIRARGEWLEGVIDPAAKGRSQSDGEQVMAQYVGLGLHLAPAENGVESGLLAVWERLSTGRIKAFKTLQNWAAEHALYRRNEKGHIVKEFDHLMDCTRYLIASNPLLYFKTRPATTSRWLSGVAAGHG